MTRNNQGPKGLFFHGGLQLFLGATQDFNKQGDQSLDHVLCDMYHEVCDHVVHLFDHYGHFWDGLDLSHVDLSRTHTSLYDVVMRRLGLSISDIHLETSRKRDHLLVVQISEEIASVMTHILRYLLEQLQANPALVRV